MKKKPLVTIITATSNIIKNNRKNTFIQTVESVKAQTYKNIEHIIIDNASDDGTIDLCKQYKLKIFSEPDSGIYNAFNKGVQHANGKYIIFLNSDDYYHDIHGISKCVKTLEKESADICYSECFFTLNENDKYVYPANIYAIFFQMPFCHQTVMTKTCILKEFPFDESYNIIADYKWLLQIFMTKRFKFVKTNTNFVFFRFNGEALKDLNKTNKEGCRVIKELITPIYELDEKQIIDYCTYGIIPKDLQKIITTYYDKPAEFYKALDLRMQQSCKSKNNEFVYDLMFTNCDKSVLFPVIGAFDNQLADINKYLYLRLNEEDKKTFINFFIKRYAKLNIDENLKEYDEIFNETEAIYQKRKSTQDAIAVNFANGKHYKFYSSTEVFNRPLSKAEQLLAYYEAVHSFVLGEYNLEGFMPNDGDVIFDCGAANGDTAIFFNSLYPNSTIFSIESDNTCFQFLCKNIEKNKIFNIKPIKAFIGEGKGFFNIDNFVKANNIKNIGLIKFDIEGYERQGLVGAINTIKEQKPVLMIPIYHLDDDCSVIPKFISELEIPYKIRLKWLERRIYGADCTLFVKFI